MSCKSLKRIVLHRFFRRATLVLAMFAGATVASSDVNAVAPRPELISPGLRQRMIQSPDSPELMWVFFRDRSFRSAAEEQKALDALTGTRPYRRKGHRPALDARDLPVCGDYVLRVSRLARVRHATRWFNGVSVEAPARVAAELTALPFVRRVQFVARGKRGPGYEAALRGGLDPGADVSDIQERVEDRLLDLRLPVPDVDTEFATAYPAEEALHYGPSFNQNSQIGIMALHRLGYTGAGITICALDTGFRTDHPAMSDRLVLAERDFVFGDDDVDNEPEDVGSAWNHGTATWSNISAFEPGTLIGGAFEAGFLLAKTEDIRSETPVEEDNYVAALEWADSLGADVCTASLLYLTFDGGIGDHTYSDLDGNTTIVAIAVDVAVSKGMAVLNSNGNSGPSSGTLGTPADADSVIAVGAIDSTGSLATFSSRGPTSDGQIKPEVVARGVNNYSGLSSLGYGPASGTSFSAPMTAGAVGLLLEAHPEWDGFAVRQALITTASQSGTPDNDYGYGIVDAAAAAATSPVSPPLVSLPFALIQPTRGSLSSSARPEFVWETSLPGAAGDTIQYVVLLSTDSLMTAPDTMSAGMDTTWTPPMYLIPGTTCYWTVLAENEAGWVRAAYMPSHFTVSPTSGAADVSPVMAGLRLGPALPNPFGPATRLTFELPALLPGVERSSYAIDVFDHRGRRVSRLASGEWGPGRQVSVATWNGRDDLGRRVSGGVYFVSLDAGGRRATLKVVLKR